MQNYNEYNKILFAVFIDYNKAFESICHEAIWESLLSQVIPKIYIKLMKTICSNSKAKIQLGQTGLKLEVKRGQGVLISQKLFSAGYQTSQILVSTSKEKTELCRRHTSIEEESFNSAIMIQSSKI